MDLPGAEGDIDEREAVEDLVLDRLRPAAADPDDPLGVLGLEPLCLAEVGDEARGGRLPDRAGVEEDQVRLIATSRPLIAQGLEHPAHPLGVVLVHLAPEGGHVVAPAGHRRERSVRRPHDPKERSRPRWSTATSPTRSQTTSPCSPTTGPGSATRSAAR